MKRLLFAASLVSLGLLAGPGALAAPTATVVPAKEAPKPTHVRAQHKGAKNGKDKDKKAPQVFNFEEDEISTDYLKPNTTMIEGLRRGRMSSLISVRLNFVDEIIKSAEDI